MQGKTTMLRWLAVAAISVSVLGAGASTAFAGQGPSNGDAPVTKATAIHGSPQNNPGFDGDSCDGVDSDGPRGVDGGCGASDIHNIAGASPGHDGASAKDGGRPPACTMHGGLGANTGAPCD